MKRWLLMMLTVSLLLSGCSGIRDGHFHMVEPYGPESDQPGSQNISVTNFDELCQALADLIKQGIKNQAISFAQYDQEKLDQDMRRAIWQLQTYDPITAYAVEKITYEKGTSTGQSAVAVNIFYIHDRAEIQKIQKAQNMKQAQQMIHVALNNCEAGVVLLLEDYDDTDFVQMVDDYAFRYPQMVIEVPKVAANVYPKTGEQRVVELKFTYSNSREVLRNMQSQVSSVFSAAELYAISKGPSLKKAELFYTFLMERYDYQLVTSVTPAYSLLCHGVGDSRAFAAVYAAMCEKTGLECQVITGTRWGQPWSWNLVCVNGVYYHIDLLRCSEEGDFKTWMDADMEGYVWDFSAYPQSVLPDTETQSATQPTEEWLENDSEYS